MSGFIVVVYLVVANVCIATGEYVFGRIVLPEVGLTAPGWWIYFWGTAFMMLFTAPIFAAKEVFK